MWADIALENREPLLALIDSQKQELAALRQALAASDGDALYRRFAAAAAARRRWEEEE